MAIKYKKQIKQKKNQDELREATPQSTGQREAAAQSTGQREADSIFGSSANGQSVFDAAVDAGRDIRVPEAIKQDAQDRYDAAKAQDTYLQDVFPGTEQDQGDQGDQGGDDAADQPDEPQGLFEDLGDIDNRQERERQAFADELEARRAEAMQQAEARAGLGGMGLSGATAELTADIGRQEARAGDIAMADLARRQQKETFDDLRRQASIWVFEEEFGVDLDGDGNYGAPPEEVPPSEAAEGDAAVPSQAVPTNRSREPALDANLVQTDETQQRGSRENPIIVNDVSETPNDARWAKDESGKSLYDENGRQLLVDSQGRYYAV
jgi:hypothetical protein